MLMSVSGIIFAEETNSVNQTTIDSTLPSSTPGYVATPTPTEAAVATPSPTPDETSSPTAETPSPTPVVYIEAETVLSTLKIIKGLDENSFKPEDNINREELSEIIVKMLGLEGTEQAADVGTVFSDVASDNASIGAINIVTGLHIINGYGDNRFGPGDPVLYEQAIKSIVNVLGYDVYATQKGGYPFGYLNVATELGITKRVEGKIGDPISKRNLAQMVYNALEVDILQISGVGTGNTYEKKSGENILTKKLKLKKKKGLVTAAGLSNIYGINDLKEDEAQIDRVTYNTGELDIKGLLGHNVIFYYTEDELSDYNKIVLIIADQNNTVISINPDDVSAVGEGNCTITYNDTYKHTQKVTIKSDASVLYNGIYDTIASKISSSDSS